MTNTLPTFLAQAPSSDALLSGSAPATPGVAQTGTPTTPGTTAPAGQQAPGGGLLTFLPIILILGFFIVVSMMSSRREKKKQADMMSSLKRGDRVVTLGGLVGIIAEIRDDVVVLRDEDSQSTKFRVLRSAIQQNLSGASSSALQADAKATDAKVEVKTKSDSNSKVTA